MNRLFLQKLFLLIPGITVSVLITSLSYAQNRPIKLEPTLDGYQFNEQGLIEKKPEKKYDKKPLPQKSEVILHKSGKAPEKVIERPYKSGAPNDYLIGSIVFSYDSRVIGIEGLKQVSAVAQDLSRFLSEPSNSLLFDSRTVKSTNPFSELAMLDQYSTYRIKIIGFADTKTNSPYNLQLGMDRAEEVARHLERFGIPMRSAVVAAYGDSQLYRDKDSRKVEVWLTQAESGSSSSMTLIYILLGFGMLVIVAIVFYFIMIQRR